MISRSLGDPINFSVSSHCVPILNSRNRGRKLPNGDADIYKNDDRAVKDFEEQIPKRTSHDVTHGSEQEPVIGQRIQTLYRI